jgi:hypothetical protein
MLTGSVTDAAALDVAARLGEASGAAVRDAEACFDLAQRHDAAV